MMLGIAYSILINEGGQVRGVPGTGNAPAHLIPETHDAKHRRSKTSI